MGRTRHRTPDPEVIERERQVLEFRRGGMTFDLIAERVGFSSGSGAHHAFRRALLRTLQEPAEAVRELEIDRLDRLQAAVWGNALKGDTRSVEAVLRIMARRASLLGLDAPQKVEATVYDGLTIDSEVARLERLLGADSGGPRALVAPAGEAAPDPA